MTDDIVASNTAVAHVRRSNAFCHLAALQLRQVAVTSRFHVLEARNLILAAVFGVVFRDLR